MHCFTKNKAVVKHYLVTERDLWNREDHHVPPLAEERPSLQILLLFVWLVFLKFAVFEFHSESQISIELTM